MFQQILALIVIAFFVARLFWQKQKKQINANEFVFWLFFWFLAAGAIVGLKWIDRMVANLGFSSSGIDVLFYIAVIILFYLIFRLRLHLAKQEKHITRLAREIAIKNQEEEK